MPRMSIIDRFPLEVRKKIEQFRRDGMTIDEIMEELSKINKEEIKIPEISRAALGKHIQKIDKIGEHVRFAQEIAKTVLEKMDGKDTALILRANLEVMYSILLGILMDSVITPESGGLDQPVDITPRNASILARTLRDLISAQKIGADWEAKIREEARKEEKDRVAQEIKRMKEKGGMSLVDIEKVTKAIYGVS